MAPIEMAFIIWHDVKEEISIDAERHYFVSNYCAIVYQNAFKNLVFND